MNMVWWLSLLYLLLRLTAKCQESVEFLPLMPLQASSESGVPVAVQVEAQHLNNAANSVLMAESWLRNHVLAHYPANNITTIIVGHTVLCSRDQQHNFGLVLPSIKNIHYSLTRWGLQNSIKVSASFSSDCLDSMSEAYRVDVAETYIKPLLTILQEIGSPYVVNPPPHLLTLSEETTNLLESHSKSMEKLGVSQTNTTSVIVTGPRKEENPSGRKLSFIDIISKRIVPFPPRPTPITPSHSPSPSHSSNPAYAVGRPLPPLVGTISPPPNSLPLAPSLPPESNPTIPPPFLPHLAPMANPASPPFGPHLPPCEPSHGGGGGGSAGAPVHHGVWCVAKPSVPAETLQEALDYACGEGKADCEAIQPDGNCHYPDTLVAHASYAFNSYWQKNKGSGGSCGFGGTAMLINSDPSYGHCRFILT